MADDYNISSIITYILSSLAGSTCLALTSRNIFDLTFASWINFVQQYFWSNSHVLVIIEISNLKRPLVVNWTIVHLLIWTEIEVKLSGCGFLWPLQLLPKTFFCRRLYLDDIKPVSDWDWDWIGI